MKLNELISKVEQLPALPGVYLFYNNSKKIIYIGKAKDLRNRVKSYFNIQNFSPKTARMIEKINDFDIILTNNEIEAFILESNLIKEHKPKYNINLKDDKSFPYIVITNEYFPRVFPTRKVIPNGSKYFGPYTDVKSMKYSLKILRDIFRIRSCKYDINEDSIKKGKIKVCLDYHIKKCDGCCEGLISAEKYGKMIKQVEKILRGKYDELLNELSSEMIEFSNNLQFEKAAEIKNMINGIEFYSNKQKVVTSDAIDADIISVAAEAPNAVSVIFNIRAGKLIGKKKLHFDYPFESEIDDIYVKIINTYIENYFEIPPFFILGNKINDTEILKEIVIRKSGKYCNFLEKKDEDLNALLKLCYQNALLELGEIKIQNMKKISKVNYQIISLQRELALLTPPFMIVCFDVSHIQGNETVASLVVFENAKPRKSKYRKYIIKNTQGINDFASMAEAVERYFKNIITDKEKLPDLIVIDGGKGQLNSVYSVLKNHKLEYIPTIGLAKRLEDIYLIKKKEPLKLSKTSAALRLLQKIRDEAHRFAISFHRDRRTKRTITSELFSIKGIGKKTTEKLLNIFGSVESIKGADINTLSVEIGLSKAKLIKNYFNN